MKYGGDHRISSVAFRIKSNLLSRTSNSSESFSFPTGFPFFLQTSPTHQPIQGRQQQSLYQAALLHPSCILLMPSCNSHLYQYTRILPVLPEQWFLCLIMHHNKRQGNFKTHRCPVGLGWSPGTVVFKAAQVILI